MENQTFATEFIILGFSTGPSMQFFMFGIFSVIYTVSLIGNALVFVVICHNSQLHTPMYFFLCHLSILDICYASSNAPHILGNLLLQRKTISFVGCGTQIYLYMALALTECVLLAVMSYDRYVAICHPLRYNVIMNWRVCTTMVACSWTCGFLFGAIQVGLTLRLPFCGLNEVDHFFCELLAVLKLACADITINQTVIFTACVLILLFPFLLVIVSYLHILATILHIHSAAARHKTFSTCSSYVTVVGLYYGTAISMYLGPITSRSALREKILSLFYSFINPMLNALIYSLRNEQVKGALVKVLRRERSFPST
ncbi:olfactory receptor 2A2-like [Alligator mississippiensis]|uniref:olfactory receptor 2A2-like n=1 Tax=Alligator mississippiensis TaxID=8496 RepID=UPI00071205B8|nr:olfactory receptor 2A2-like [Alligator mississippiensis]